MNREKLKEMHVNWQITDFDDDIVGICYELVHWMREVNKQAQALNAQLSPPEDPEKFFKLQPHFPKMQYRKNLRKVIVMALREEDDSLCLSNLFTSLLAAAYVYHMPSQAMYELALNDKEFTREDSKQLLLDDTMSTNWLKEPSGRDFTALYETV
jgi:hypothetical protein